jgi:sterol desaturase/sphingolipid hydroxylase (fatty acid hydroxylase superfamily)
MIEFLMFLPLALIPLFMLIGLVHEARTYEKPAWWKTRMTLATIAVVGGSMGIAGFWGTILGNFSLLDGSRLGTLVGAPLGILVYEFVHYWYHRTAHRYDWLWRLGHQMHHSAEAMDAFSANYLHPLDLFMFVSASSLVFYPLLGLTLEAGLIGGVWAGFNAMFQHANIRTPRWLGYLIQRPESHVLHHARGRHCGNYANLPLWDMAYGTFENPRDVDGVEAGFYNGASTRVWDMLMFRDVSRPEHAPAPREAEAPMDQAA